MATHIPDLQAIAERLEKVERENRRLRRAGLAALVLGCAVLVMGQVRPARTIESSQFILKDANGRVRAQLTMDPANRPTLTLSDEKGHAVVSLIGGDDHPFLGLSGAGGEERVMLMASKDSYGLGIYGEPQGAAGGTGVVLGVWKGIPGLTLYDERGKERAALQLARGQPTLVVSDPNGPRAVLGVLAGAVSTLGLYDETGKVAAALRVTGDKTSFELFDKEGFQITIGSTDLVTPRTGETHKTSAASIVLSDKDKKVLWSAP